MSNIREQIYLAALLHDIGKFYQRADSGSVKNSEYLSEHCKDEGTFCPLGKGGVYSHKHVLWTAQFIEDYNPVFQRLLQNEKIPCDRINSLMVLAAGHHLKAEQLSESGQLIKEADCLSSGMDRDSELAYKDEQDESSGWDSFKKKSMFSILETVFKTNSEIEKHEHWSHIPVRPLSLDSSNFPIIDYSLPEYGKLWKEFIREFKFIQADTYHAFSETFLNLLFKYTSCIPASTVNFPDVSLYDHLKTTAALALCLYDVNASGENSEKPFLLIGGDLSGIQPYIYEIASKYAGKNLKGRSFYLRLLSDSVVRYLLKSLNLPTANIIYNSGGGFYILAPNTSAVKSKLADASSFIEHQLFETHHTSLYLAIDSIEFSKDTLLHRNGKNLGKIWGELFAKRDTRKFHQFSSLISNNYSLFFEPSMSGGNSARDIITGEEFSKSENPYSENELSPLKKVTKEQIELGKILRKTDVMVVSEEEIPYWKDKVHIQPGGFGSTYYFIQWEDVDKMKMELRASADKVTVVTLNGKNGDCDFMRERQMDGINNIYALEFYGGNEYDRNNMPTFEQMCQKADIQSMKRIGVLRMDVDNLGLIFQKGISPERSTLSRYSALSRSFDWFFSGYLNTIWREVAPDQTFIIYSGGDDVFIVGSWEQTILFAERIRDDFKKYVCHNPAFAISGGISILPVKYPIMKGADESACEEKLAKEHSVGNASKNSISFLKTPLNWDKEYPQVKSLKDAIIEACRNEIPKSFISKVMQHASNADIKNHKFSTAGIKTYWMLAYDLSRMEGRVGHPLIEKCKTEICGNKHELNGKPIESSYHPMELWAFACRWAELEMRTNQSE